MTMQALKRDNYHKYKIKTHNNWRVHVFVFIAAFGIIFSRRPDALLNAQFWAEDGQIWYADAYNQGIIHSLFSPFNGYFQTTSRLTAAIAQFFPLGWAPLIFNLTAIIIKILPVHLIISSRFTYLIPNIRYRFYLAFFYLALPNSFEVHANITNAHWYLAILAYLVLLATPSMLFIWRFFDISVILLLAFSGPFSLLLIPSATILWLRRRQTCSLILSCLYAGALVQSITILLTAHHARVQTPLGATPALFTKILGQVFLGALIGQQGLQWVSVHFWGYNLLLVFVAIAGIAAFFYSFLKAPLELRLFASFATLVFCISLTSPMASESVPQWLSLSVPGSGCRYWFIPMLGFVTLIFWLLGKKQPPLIRIAAVVTVAIMIFGIVLDWHYPAFANLEFQTYANKFITAPHGAKVKIPINPPGWFMELTKY